jgi:GT2 family glycosyltransferase
MAEEQAPPVVAVVVSSDPGPWLEECLEALVAQDYPSLSILVVDGASEEPLAARVAAVDPTIFLHRLAANRGFGPSANAVSGLVEGATFYLFCHDDVLPDADVVSLLVREAYRQNAAVAAPKLVDRDEPERILQLGLGVDRFGAPVGRVERREFDQAQHDSTRDVFAVPGACTLVRADLFEAIGGYDDEISMFGEDVDFCWRARLVGARIVVVPQATVAHLEATAARRRPLPAARALQWRHELRAVLKNYGRARRALVVSQLAALSLAEIVFFVIVGRRRRSKEVIDAWRWNLEEQRGLKRAREAVISTRVVPDRVVARYFSRHSFRVWRYLLQAGGITLSRWRRARRAVQEGGRPRPHRERRPRYVTGIAVAAIVVLAFGARALLSGHIPLIGDFLPLPSPPDLLGRFFGGFQDAGLQHPGPATPAFALLGVAGIIVVGAMGVVFKVGLIVAIVAGALGVARLVRPFAPPLARLVAGIAYCFLPLCWDDLARGDLFGLVAFAGMPWVIGRIARASGVAPFGDNAPPGLLDARSAREVVGFGILLALLGAFSPGVVILAVVAAVLFVLSGVLVGQLAASLRALVVTLGAALVAFVLCLPWSLTFVQRGVRWSVLSGAASLPTRNPNFASTLRMDIGPLGAGVLGYAFLVAALGVLAVGRFERLTWAIRWWVVAALSFALCWAASEGWLGAGGGLLGTLLAPAAVCLSVLIGLGVAAMLQDVSREQLGWRHAVSAVFVLALGAGLLPVLGATPPGRFSVPGTGYDAVLSFTATGGRNGAAERTLWLGDPAALPLPAWQVAPGFALGVSAGGLPTGMALWPSANPGAAVTLADDVRMAENGATVRLGALLAPEGVRYLIVPTAHAPVLSGEQSAVADPPPVLLLDGLAAQLDLRELPAEGGTLVFENTAWHTGDGAPNAVLGRGGLPAVLRVVAAVAECASWGALVFFYIRRRRRQRAQHTRRSRHRRDEVQPEAEPVALELVSAEVGS